MIRCLALIAALLLAGCAARPERPTFQLPPPAYRATGAVILRTEKDVRPFCKNDLSLACTIGTYVILPDPRDYLDEYFAGLLCHELAHALKGWKHEPR